jgi:hypothetical protein
MSIVEARRIASELIVLDVPISHGYAETVRSIVGSKWTYMAGVVGLRPQKSFERRLPLFEYSQRSIYEKRYQPYGGSDEFKECFDDSRMNTIISAIKTHGGTLLVNQYPLDPAVETLRTTTADVGRMMLADEVLHMDRVGDLRPRRLDLARALLEASQNEMDRLTHYQTAKQSDFE